MMQTLTPFSHFQEFVVSQNRPKSTSITRLIQGYEMHSFKSNFDSWPSGSAPVAEEGRGKVAGKLVSFENKLDLSLGAFL